MKIAFTALAASAVLATALLPASAQTRDDEAVPAEQMIAAIRTATEAAPGLVKEAEVDRKDGRLLIKVKTIGSDGIEKKLSIDPLRGQVVRRGESHR